MEAFSAKTIDQIMAIDRMYLQLATDKDPFNQGMATVFILASTMKTSLEGKADEKNNS